MSMLGLIKFRGRSGAFLAGLTAMVMVGFGLPSATAAVPALAPALNDAYGFTAEPSVDNPCKVKTYFYNPTDGGGDIDLEVELNDPYGGKRMLATAADGELGFAEFYLPTGAVASATFYNLDGSVAGVSGEAPASPCDANGDEDGDGVKNGVEESVGSDPTDAASVPATQPSDPGGDPVVNPVIKVAINKGSWTVRRPRLTITMNVDAGIVVKKKRGRKNGRVVRKAEVQAGTRRVFVFHRVKRGNSVQYVVKVTLADDAATSQRFGPYRFKAPRKRR